ncbi:MAG TPA: DUF5666 domain-containing protein [Armatimonadota bacterium]|jgi:hypothetical protein
MAQRRTRWDTVAQTAGLIVPAIAMLALAPPALAGGADKQTGWGAATAGLGMAAVVEAIKQHPDKALIYGVGAAASYDQYRRAGNEANDRDPYGYDNGPSWRSGDYGDYGVRYTSRTREVSGRLVNGSGAFDRDIRVHLENDETRTIDVPRGIPIRRDRDSISVHELKSGETLRVSIERYREDGSLRARRIDVIYTDSRDGRYDDRDVVTERVTGRVSSIDSRAEILRIDVDGRILTVYTDSADLRDGDGVIRLRDLQRGDRVTVEGRRTGDRIRAARVTLR